MNTFINRLQENRVKITPKRKAIIEYFKEEDRCVTPEAVWKNLKSHFDQCGLPSIYRNLDLFERCGILTKIRKEDQRLYYALSKNKGIDARSYVFCVKCGKVKALADGYMPPKREISGYQILKRFLHVEGICEECS